MKFRTSLPDAESSLHISHSSSLLAMGSCFADRMGERLHLNKFKVAVNPLGICYNPISLIRQISWIMGEEELAAIRYQEGQDRWHSFDLHSSWSSASKSALEDRLQKARQDLRKCLKKLDVLMLTFGTARVYRYKDTEAIVANNYAYPGACFKRELLSADVLFHTLSRTLNALKTFNPSLQILISVSPIRHIRDGLEENSVSKANLRILCHKLVEAHGNIHYFPAYEVMMDDLRDYRFYQADLIHPNEQAEEYIWELFKQKHIAKASWPLLKEIMGIRKDLQHKAFNPRTPAHQRFLQSVLKKIERLPDEVSFEQERKVLLKQLEDF